MIVGKLSTSCLMLYFAFGLHSVGVWENSVVADLTPPWKKNKKRKKKKKVNIYPAVILRKCCNLLYLRNKNSGEQSNSALWEVHVNADYVI